MTQTEHRSPATRAVRSYRVSVGSAFEKRATRLYKLLAFLLPQGLLFKVCVAPYEVGIFFLKFFNVVLEQLELRAEKGDMLLDDGNAFHVTEGRDQATQGQK